MDVVTQDHLTLLGSVDANVIVYILSTLAEGIASVGMYCAVMLLFDSLTLCSLYVNMGRCDSPWMLLQIVYPHSL